MKEVIRIQDTVKIINPMVFVRVGYPYNLQYAKDNLVTKEEKNLIEILSGGWDGENTYQTILKAVAYKKLKESGFGGNSRQIFTEKNDRVDLNVDYEVLEKKMVKTGIYCRGSKGSWECPVDCDPPTLRNSRNHQILKVQKVYKDLMDYEDPFWIEKKNVVKIVE
jgi:hypothetical protein